MLDRFPTKLRDLESLFCPACKRVEAHAICLPAHSTPAPPLAPDLPLLAQCRRCGQGQVLFGRDFRKFSPEQPPDSFCKIFGRSRLLVRDWVYAPGWARPGQVKSRFRSGSTETFLVAWGPGNETQLQQNCCDDLGPDAIESYRLLPYQAGVCRIGDSIYHVVRESFGTVVGFQWGRESRLVVQMEDRSLLLITLPEVQLADNTSLIKLAIAQLTDILGSEARNLRIQAGQGVLYAGGVISSLPLRAQIKQCLDKLPSCRGWVDLLQVQPTVLLPDDALESLAHEALLDCGIPVFGLGLECEFGVLTLRGFVRHEGAKNELETRLSRLPGLHDLVLQLRLRPTENSSERQRKQLVAKALQRSGSLDHVRIRVASVDDIIYLEGSVLSALQKNTATLTAMWGAKGLKVENNLKVVHKLPAKSFILAV